MNKLVEINNLCKKYYTKEKEIMAIKDISFDVYEGENIGANKKSIAFSLSFGASDRTLTDEEVNSVLTNIIERLGKSLGAELRK